MDNPVVLILLIALACAAVIGANFYRRRETAAEARTNTSRRDEASRGVDNTPERSRPAPVRPAVRATGDAPVSYVRPVQQPQVQDTSGSDLVNLVLMQQALNSIGHDHHHEEHREEHVEEHRNEEQPQEDAPEQPAAFEAPAAHVAEPAYAAPEPVYVEPASYQAPETPSYDTSPTYSDSGSFGGGDSGSF